MKKSVLINNEPSEILGWFSVYGHSALVLSKSNISENYFYIFPDNLKLFGLEHLIFYNYNSNFIDPNYNNNCFFEINENYFFKIIYDLKNKWIGNLMKKDKSIVYDLDIKIDGLRQLENGEYVLFDIEKYKNKKIKMKNIVYEKIEEIEKIIQDKSEFQIIKHLNHPLHFDENGVLRFKKQIFTKEEAFLFSDLNNTWIKFHNNELNFSSLVSLHMKSGCSVGFFIDCFYNYFFKFKNLDINEDKDEDKHEYIYEICSEDEILSILSDKIKPFSD